LSPAERSAIVRGSHEACATATDLKAVLSEVRREATSLRSDSVKLRDEARTVREGLRR